MALQLAVSTRTARAAAIETDIGTSPTLTIFSGAVPANCAAADPAGSLAVITLPSDWVAQASGLSSLLGSWTVAAANAGTGISFRIKTSAAVCKMQGTVGLGSGDLSLNNNVIAAGQTVTVTQFDMTEPNS